MIWDILNIFVGIGLFLASLKMIFDYIRKRKINFYFLILLLFSGVARFHYGISSLGLISFANEMNARVFVMMILMPPIYLLSIKTFFSSRISRNELRIHAAIITTTLMIRFLSGIPSVENLRLIFILYFLLYYCFLGTFVFKFLKTTQTIYSKHQLFKAKQLIIWLVSLSLNNSIYTLYTLYFDYTDYHSIVQGMFRGTGIIWSLFCIYILFKTSILENKVFRKKEPNRDFSKDFNIWKTISTKRIDPRDLKLEKSIHDNINRYITTLKELETERILKSTSASLISDLSLEFNYPKSHLKFIFKYYCHLSITDYLNLMKLIHALTLINDGYLTNFTFESLAETCHFNSRTSFYRHFKKHLGVSPSQYKLFIE